MESVEKRKRTIINAVYFTLLIGIFYLFMKYAFWLFFPFITAFFIAALIQRPVNFVSKRTHIGKGIVSGIFVLLLFVLFLFLMSLLGIKIVTEAKSFATFLVSRAESIPSVLESLKESLTGLAGKLPRGIGKSVQGGIENFFNTLLVSAEAETEGAVSEVGAIRLSGGILSKLDMSMLSAPINGVWSTAKQIPSVIVAAIITVIAGCFMTADYDRIVNFIKRQISPKKRVALSAAKNIFYSSLGKMVKSYLIIICITFAEMFIGLSLLKLIGVYKSGYIVSIALVVALIDIVPVLGTGTVLIPWALFCLVTGKIGLCIGLAVLYAVITVIRQIIEPKLVASNLGLPPIVTIMGMYIGLQIFGFIGLFIMPIVIIMVKLLNDRGIISIWKTEETAEICEERTTDQKTQKK